MPACPQAHTSWAFASASSPACRTPLQIPAWSSFACGWNFCSNVTSSESASLTPILDESPLSLSGPCRAPDYLKLYFYLLICRLSLQASESRCACPVPCCALPARGHDGGRANIVHSLPGPHSPSHWWGHTVTSSKPAAPFPGVRG